MRALQVLCTIHSHADTPEAAKLGKRKASSEHLARPDKKVMTVSYSKLCYSPPSCGDLSPESPGAKSLPFPHRCMVPLPQKNFISFLPGYFIADPSTLPPSDSSFFGSNNSFLQDFKMQVDGPIQNGEQLQNGDIDESLYSRQLWVSSTSLLVSY